MIDHIQIEDLGVIAKATLPLGPGFTAITGETGAGKTMVISALGLLMGERSESSGVRSGAARARVTGIIKTADNAVAQIVENAGGELDEGELALVRTVNAEGRSRASVGGAGAPSQVLQQLAPLLFVVHGQSDQLRLKSQTAQRASLDSFGGQELLSVAEKYRDAYDARAASEKELLLLQTEKLERVREAERLRLEVDEITKVDPQPEEIDELKAAIERLGNVEEIRLAVDTARAHLGAGESVEENATVLLAGAARELDRVAHADEKLKQLLELNNSLTVQVEELARELSEYSNDLDFDGPAELMRASDRLAELMTLTRKYGANTEEVLAYAAEAAERLATLDGDDLRVESLEAQVLELTQIEKKLREQLSGLRRAAALELGEKVTLELRELAMPEASFEVALTDSEPSRNGAETIEMLIAPHPGATLRPVAKAASGGELSRVMLALEVVLAGRDPVPTFVFDEVDAGVGGAAATEIGRRLAKLAQTAQVIVVTHLAQVAAFADNHLLVQKDSAGGYTQSSCTRLEGDKRLSEMARLLSGMSDSASALEHAAELLNHTKL